MLLFSDDKSSFYFSYPEVDIAENLRKDKKVKEVIEVNKKNTVLNYLFYQAT